MLALSACGDSDDGGEVRNVDGTGAADAAASASGSASASGAGSGSGLSASDVEGTGAGNEDPLVHAAVEEYSLWVESQVADMVATTATFTDAVRAGDLEAAKAAFAPSRQEWERIEPIAGLIEEIDTKVDARVDDFASPDDPEWTGWHRIEYLLWERGTTDGAAQFADQLDADLASLQEQLPTLEITPLAMARGSAELIEEVSTGKIQGEEDRYSKTDLWDFAANVEGSKMAFSLVRDFAESKGDAGAGLVAEIDGGYAALEESLARHGSLANGFVGYAELTDEDKREFTDLINALAEPLSQLTVTVLE
jgi:iron uptake system component EfeO